MARKGFNIISNTEPAELGNKVLTILRSDDADRGAQLGVLLDTALGYETDKGKQSLGTKFAEAIDGPAFEVVGDATVYTAEVVLEAFKARAVSRLDALLDGLNLDGLGISAEDIIGAVQAA